LPLTVAGNCGAAFGATKLSLMTKVSWKEILSKPKNKHHNCLLLAVRASLFTMLSDGSIIIVIIFDGVLK